MAEELTPYLSDSSRCVRILGFLRISKTSSSVSLLEWWFSPFFGVPRRSRPFRIMSWVFSIISPVLRCAGFTQQGTSQECRTHSPGGIGPINNSWLTRCARTLLRAIFSIPYPHALTRAVQSQHPLSVTISNLLLNLSMIGFGSAIAESPCKIGSWLEAALAETFAAFSLYHRAAWPWA